MKATRALVFDMDGTMVDSMPAHARAWEHFARSHGNTMPVAEILRRTTGRNGVECIRELFGADTPEDRALELIAQKEEIYREAFSREFREVKGFGAFAAQARAQGLKITVATAGDKHNIAYVLRHLKLAHAPDAIVGGDEGLPGKPEPALFLEAARRVGIAPAECIVFEDAPFGIEAARRAGMRAVAICSTHSPEQLSGPHVVAQVRDFEQLTKTNFLENLHA
ncbi:HAD family phosphatase [Ramlibacter sp. XY19]|uniref:HAD family hydrolase n=1 Tax=Ramlibacter paludis TaxID=2908000 RepID=UPI0023DB20FB|nr:HAD family phosphatase [Ramlibacter paludis]MCG2594308.1 HAD family phosphatase [Ramlibacter paludis]